MRLGAVVNVAGLVVPVEELFLTTVQAAEFDGPLETSVGDTFYGFAGTRDGKLLLASWNAEDITFWRGRRLSARSVLAALGH